MLFPWWYCFFPLTILLFHYFPHCIFLWYWVFITSGEKCLGGSAKNNFYGDMRLLNHTVIHDDKCSSYAAFQSMFSPYTDETKREWGNFFHLNAYFRSGDFNWKRNNGPTDTARTGPPFDHTTGSLEGFYMYAESTGREGGDRARISTPVVPGSGSQCTGFDFWWAKKITIQ